MGKSIILENVNKTYYPSHDSWQIFKKKELQQIQALKNINLAINKGSIVGIVGHNGSGKTTLMNIILGAIAPDKGSSVFTDGKIIKLALGAGFDRNLSGRENILTNLTLFGLSKEVIGHKIEEVVAFSGISKFIDIPVKYLSKGMKSRLTFSIAMHADADIFLFDEFFGGVGDEDFRNKSQEKFLELLNSNKTIVIISHGKKILKSYCSELYWLHKGQIKKSGDPEELLKEYQAFYKKNKLQ